MEIKDIVKWKKENPSQTYFKVVVLDEMGFTIEYEVGRYENLKEAKKAANKTMKEDEEAFWLEIRTFERNESTGKWRRTKTLTNDKGRWVDCGY